MNTVECTQKWHTSMSSMKSVYVSVKYWSRISPINPPQLTVPLSFKEREVCIKEAKRTIQLLGDSLDNNCIDEEGSWLLDTVTMLALSESFTFYQCLLSLPIQTKKADSKSHLSSSLCRSKQKSWFKVTFVLMLSCLNLLMCVVCQWVVSLSWSTGPGSLI